MLLMPDMNYYDHYTVSTCPGLNTGSMLVKKGIPVKTKKTLCYWFLYAIMSMHMPYDGLNLAN